MQTIRDLAPQHGVRPLCHALGVAPATYYRHREALSKACSNTCRNTCSNTCSPASPAAPAAAPVKRSSKRALATAERERVLEVLHEPRFVDLAPAEIYATLLDEGTYLCSERTMYRLLAAEGEVRERRAQRRHPVYQAPELLATKQNQLWSWDITRLKGPAKWSYFNLYVVLDVFSRFVVGWMVAHRESATLAERLITTCCERQGILPDCLTIHADRGSAMTSKSVALLLADLGVTKTHSRPHVSNDNPYSESQFKTMKYRPDFPERFGSIQHARSHSAVFFDWYNLEHRHSGLGLLTPFDVHHGLAEERRNQRAAVLRAAYEATPERFVRQLPVPPALPTAAWINPPKLLTLSEDVAQ